jgi:acyl-CoA thioesterase-1
MTARWIIAFVAGAGLAAAPVQAQTARVVALGASNTAGKGVGAGAAWPAQLQALLRRQGHAVQVINAGISGDDTGRMLARLARAVPAGTRLVIVDKAATNDRLRGIDTDANVAAITARLQARGVSVIVISGMHDWAGRRLQPDGVHITAEGHAAVAARLAPQVAGALGAAGR